ncbi:argininosuccinate synthase [Chitinispirillales bacterium ANBcel5]|uniref:argininosuccinate synthase n=1 Tax=Cellulosispirillum alkaliphilum TaxID=3039283 RepID=UPI002A541B0C|nr:argininosuccinate synthase [Chitinispirillales bacterium ANBcel5]
MEKVVLLYSGGLDTSIMIPWLKENYNCKVIAMCADLGQEDELGGLEEKALKTGASKLYIETLTSEFITDFIYPTLKAGAVYEGTYLLGTSFARPLISKRAVEIAQKEGATAIAHGATGKGNDQVRFELTIMALDPSLKIIAPWKDPKWDLHSREECIAYAKKHNIPVSQSKKRIYSEDRNIWHISHEGGVLEDPQVEPPDDVYTLSNTLENAPDKAEYLEIAFEKGIPVAINGEKKDPVALLTELNKAGARHAIGHVDLVENRLVGIKSRGIYETPGGTILYAAHRQLENLVLDRDTSHFKDMLAIRYAELVYNGQWYCDLREALDGFVDVTQKNVTGTVKVKLYKGNIVCAGTKAEKSLYIEDLASFSNTELYDQMDATGFIKIFGLPMKVAGMVDRKNTK